MIPMSRLPLPIRYLSTIRTPRMVLWCYLIWYVVTVVHHFDPSPRIWLNSLGISAVIGTALLLSLSGGRNPWETFRLFLMPFCVSSFSSLIKGQGFILVVPPRLSELTVSLIGCAVFLSTVFLIKRLTRTAPALRPTNA
jgi:hypothetical protein